MSYILNWLGRYVSFLCICSHHVFLDIWVSWHFVGAPCNFRGPCRVRRHFDSGRWYVLPKPCWLFILVVFLHPVAALWSRYGRRACYSSTVGTAKHRLFPPDVRSWHLIYVIQCMCQALYPAYLSLRQVSNVARFSK